MSKRDNIVARASGPNRGGVRRYMIFMVDPSQMPTCTCFRAFSSDTEKEIPNDRHHSKTDLAVVKQERQQTSGQYANEQRRRNRHQTNLAATQP